MFPYFWDFTWVGENGNDQIKLQDAVIAEALQDCFFH